MLKLTVGLLAYNEVNHLPETICSILAQDFNSCEIVVGDNASTDGTSDVVSAYTKQDPRIVHIQRPKNIGALQNWNDVVRQAKGEYFVLAGGHDLWSPAYLKKLVAALDENPHAVVAFARTQWIDESGSMLDKRTSILDTSAMSSLGRFVSLMFANQHYLYGVIRLSALRCVLPQKEVIGSGELILQKLAQLGDFVFVEGERWYRRKNRRTESTMDRLRRYETVLFASTVARLRFRFFPHGQMLVNYCLLPFLMKGPTLWARMGMLALLPLILFRFIGPLWVDLCWLVRR